MHLRATDCALGSVGGIVPGHSWGQANDVRSLGFADNSDPVNGGRSAGSARNRLQLHRRAMYFGRVIYRDIRFVRRHSICPEVLECCEGHGAEHCSRKNRSGTPPEIHMNLEFAFAGLEIFRGLGTFAMRRQLRRRLSSSPLRFHSGPIGPSQCCSAFLDILLPRRVKFWLHSSWAYGEEHLHWQALWATRIEQTVGFRASLREWAQG